MIDDAFITLDFETFYDRVYSLSKLTTEEYVRDPRFEVIGVGVKVGNHPTDWFSGSMDETRDWLHSIDWSNKKVLAHNTLFDGAILSWHFGIRPKLWLDTLSMARPIYGTTTGCSLAAVAKALGIGEKGNEVLAALGKRRADFTPAELAQYGRYCKNDVDLCRDIFEALRPQFSNAELLLIDQTIRMFTEPVLELDNGLLINYLQSVREGKAELLRTALKTAFTSNRDAAAAIAKARLEGKTLRDMLMSNDIFAELLRSAGVEPPMKTSLRTGKEAYAFAKTDKEFTALQEHEDPTVQALVSARLGVKSTIEETRAERFVGLSERGAFPIPLNYSGAFQTWRWSGADKLNLQNLPRGGTLRHAIRAPEGYAIVAVDSSNIELRVNHTLAGQLSSVESFRAGRDLYCEFASVLFGRPITKADKNERQLGKLAHLSLGYGCGWQKFQHICRLNKVALTDEEAQRIVKLWRDTYSMIPKFWRAADAALPAIHAGVAQAVGPSGLILTCGEGLRTPPQHMIRYAELRREEDGGWTYLNRKQRKNVYGGSMVENICQHIARNIIADQWVKSALWCAKNAPEWRVVLQVHDEIVLCGPARHAELVETAVVKIMSTAPAWWPEVPLAAEGGIGETYGDAH